MTISAGSEIDAWCTSCRMTLNHRVVAMVQGVAKRVLCLTCNKQHNYRAPRSEGAASARPDREESASSSRASKKQAASPKAATASNSKEWMLNVANKDSTDFLPYSIHRTFEVGQLVNHPKFGEGYVKEALTAQKLCVLFRDGPRTLVHGVPG